MKKFTFEATVFPAFMLFIMAITFYTFASFATSSRTFTKGLSEHLGAKVVTNTRIPAVVKMYKRKV